MIALDLCLVDAEQGGCVVTIFHPIFAIVAIVLILAIGGFSR